MACRLLALMLVTPLLLLGVGYANHQAPVPKVLVSEPIPREVIEHSNYLGNVEPGEAFAICARLAGEVVSFHFKPGETVGKGALLFQMDDRLPKVALMKAEAELERIHANLRRTSADLDRVKRLLDSGHGSREEYEKVVAGRAESEAVLKVARANLEMARLNLEGTRILSPIAGKVGKLAVTPGTVVTAGSRLAVVSSLQMVDVAFEMDERTALRFLRGEKGKRVPEIQAEVGLSDEAGYPHRGLANLHDLQFTPTTGTAQVRVRLPNAEGLFLPGLSARVRLVEGKPYKAQMISPLALHGDNQGSYVLVVGPGNVLERRQVKYGREQGGLIPVREGLKAGDLVAHASAVRGPRDSLSLTPGMVVDPEKVAMPERSTRRESSPDWKGFSPSGGKGKKGRTDR